MQFRGYDLTVSDAHPGWTDRWDPADRRLVIDGAMAAELRRLGSDVLGPLLEMFADTSRAGIERIGAALDRRDFTELRHRAHELAGGAGYLAAASVANHARAIESAARNENSDEIRALLETLPAHVAAAVEALRHIEQL